ncbi:hypothetical protein PHMEG_00016258 [Phytophthora megakarya]|uniref:Uncharacterized protein n=1 Tax=Phytophthora megakarya TaxID=4795 RepID=A0A225VZQ7_9STRA|nr:hypothetical protein PHMEG_00016258 [Phytophthora megakarya]
MTSATTATAFTTKLKQFNGTGFPAWGAQVKLVLEIKGLWADVERVAPSVDGLAAETEKLSVYT